MFNRDFGPYFLLKNTKTKSTKKGENYKLKYYKMRHDQNNTTALLFGCGYVQNLLFKIRVHAITPNPTEAYRKLSGL